MNPNVCEKRGCFIRSEENEKFTVVDYPTWTFNQYGLFIPYQNEPIGEGKEFERTFDTKDDAMRFCSDENYVVCSAPRKPSENPPDTPHQYDDYDFN